MKKKNKEEIFAIITSFIIAVPILVIVWWLYNFAVYVYDGTYIPMWIEFNRWVHSLFV